MKVVIDVATVVEPRILSWGLKYCVKINSNHK